MTPIFKASSAIAVIASLAFATAPANAQQLPSDYDRPAANGDVLTTVTGSPPADLSSFERGPDFEGFISRMEGSEVEITTQTGERVRLLLSEGTSIRQRSGLFGINRTSLSTDALLDGLPVSVETVQFGRSLVARTIRFNDEDYDTALMIQNGTSRRFAQQDVRIDENAAAADELRGRLGNLDNYAVRSTTNVYFDTGRSTLSPLARQELCAAAAQAEQIDNALILVVGYTDSTGSPEVNQRLSEERAAAVVNFLQQECNWQPWRMLSPTGMSESNPAADNTTIAGRSQNRRVAVNVLVSRSVEGLDTGRTAAR